MLCTMFPLISDELCACKILSVQHFWLTKQFVHMKRHCRLLWRSIKSFQICLSDLFVVDRSSVEIHRNDAFICKIYFRLQYYVQFFFIFKLKFCMRSPFFCVRYTKKLCSHAHVHSLEGTLVVYNIMCKNCWFMLSDMCLLN